MLITASSKKKTATNTGGPCLKNMYVLQQT